MTRSKMEAIDRRRTKNVVYPGLLESSYPLDPATVFERLRSDIGLVSTSRKSFGKFEGNFGIESKRKILRIDDDPSI